VAGRGRLLKRLTRFRMAQTGERYTEARRALLADPAEFARVRAAEAAAQRRAAYPSTDRDGLGARHVLSAWETARRRH
jgi:hypothetical protein